MSEEFESFQRMKNQIDDLQSENQRLSALVEKLAETGTWVLNYPGLRKYIGTQTFDPFQEALSAYREFKGEKENHGNIR